MSFNYFSPQSFKKREEDEKIREQKDHVDNVEKNLRALLQESPFTSVGGSFDIGEKNILFQQMKWVEKKLTALGWKVEIKERNIEVTTTRYFFLKKTSFYKVRTVICRS